jgi:hypothetical protein
MTPRTWLFIFLGALTLLRLAYAGQTGLFPDESYYQMWSERMDWCYFSKGPGVAASIWLGTHLAGVNELGVRLLSPLLGLGTSLLLFSFARRLYGESAGIWTAAMINALPIFNVGALVMTIDPLSIFFWTAALYTFWLALARQPAFSAWWPATGALIGLGFLSKYTNAMELLSIVLLLAFTRKYRREFLRPGFWSMLAVFALSTIPPIRWNAEREWVTLAHLSARGGLHKAFAVDFGELGTFIAIHFGVYSPLIFGAMVVAGAWGLSRASVQWKPRFLLAFALPLFALYGWLSLKQAGEANWTAPGAISLGVLAVGWWHERAERSAGARRFAVAALALGVVCSLLVLNLDVLRACGIAWPYSRDPGTRMRGWRTAAAKVEEVRAKIEAEWGEPVFLIANEHEVAASLSFYMKEKRVAGAGHPPVYIPESQEFQDQFSFWPRYDEFIDPRLAPHIPRDEFFTEGGVNPFMGRSALYITDRVEEKAPSAIKGGFEQVEMIACIDQVRRGMALRQLRVFACRRYRSLPL